jgi:hypothetical protein
MTSKLVATISSCAFVLFLSPLALGGLIIATFSSGEYVVGIGTDVVVDRVDSGSMLGGARHTFAETLNFGTSSSTTMSVQNGAWTLNNVENGIPRASVGWGQHELSFAGTALDLDLGIGDQFFEYDITNVEGNAVIGLAVYSGVNEGNSQVGRSQFRFLPLGTTTQQTARVDFSNPNFTGVDFTDIDAIRLDVSFPTWDFSVTELRIGAAAVPEPTSLTMFGIALPLALRRRR